MTTATEPMRLRVETWDPAYGASTEEPAELGRSSAQVTLDVEVDESRWRPVDPDPSADRTEAAVLFVDGVRRIDAMAWIPGPDSDPDTVSLALCASYAAGAVRCQPAGARLLTAEVRRGLFSISERATDLPTTAGSYRRVRVAAHGDPGQDLNLAVQRELATVEAAVAESAALESGGGDDVLVVDGPLRGRAHLPRALGFIKTHRSEYLPPAQHRIVGALEPGQRTPVFALGTSWRRCSWYLKLPGRPGAPWAGVVRVECSAELPVAEVVELANRSQPMLARYASSEYKDARAPQNLYPIAGLERELRRRLGDRALLYRAIRRAAISM
ncbi:hypothetical protein [Pseudonocardia acaciae]|uniref:hypothetical protein n=1 Tax=Pseudonocardia acaciae TaxID=551276 RepID=UPI000AE67DE1|nr:hypothetical protein [Pseudonocardia acaciae]